MMYLKPAIRRVVYVSTFELLAIFLSSLLLSGMSDGNMSNALPVAVGVSVIAVIWNYVYNTLFEGWENRRGIVSRSFGVRIVHTLLFEAGFILLAVPLFMWWYRVDIITAFVMELGILVFFLFYTFAFTWAFDTLFVREPKAVLE